jgi:spore coat-associated protein N
MERLSLLARSPRWLLLASLALLSLALGSAIFSGATFTSKSANSASLAAAGLQLSSSAPNQAIVGASGMRPGDSRQGTISIGNRGSAAGALTLRATGLTGAALASVIELRVEEVTAGGAKPKWSGALDSFDGVDLGSFATGARRTYRIGLSWPAAAADPSLQGSSTSFAFRWSASS